MGADDQAASEVISMEGSRPDLEDGSKLESHTSNVSASELVVQRHGTAFSACFEMFIAGMHHSLFQLASVGLSNNESKRRNRISHTVMGPGSLSLAFAMSALGWVGGLFSMAIFAIIVYAFAHILILCHQEGNGKRHRTYYSAVHNILGKRHAIAYVYMQFPCNPARQHINARCLFQPTHVPPTT